MIDPKLLRSAPADVAAESAALQAEIEDLAKETEALGNEISEQ